MKTQTKKLTPVQIAKQAMKDFIKYKNQKAKIEAAQRLAKQNLEAFAKANRAKFDEDGNYKMPGGYLHFGTETEVVPCENFSFAQFMHEFPELVDKKFKTSAIKAILQSDEGKQKLLANHCVELKGQEIFSVVVK